MSPLTGGDSRGLVLGLALDAAIGDPTRWHPVAGFGQSANAVQEHLERDNRGAGVRFVIATVGPTVVLGVLADRWASRSTWRRTALTAATCFAVTAGRSLRSEAAGVHRQLAAGDLDIARFRLRSLCGRDASALDEEQISRAVIESVAENTSDATIGPLTWWALAGVPGMLAYRAVNTLDAMVGHHSARYERFGWAAARTDDAMNLLPARIGGAVAVACAPLVGGSSRAALRSWRRDAKAHPSPNAGVVEATFAGALGVRLGGPIDYPYGPSDRPVLNPTGTTPTPSDITRAVRLSRAVQTGSVLICLLLRRARVGGAARTEAAT